MLNDTVRILISIPATAPIKWPKFIAALGEPKPDDLFNLVLALEASNLVKVNRIGPHHQSLSLLLLPLGIERAREALKGTGYEYLAPAPLPLKERKPKGRKPKPSIFTKPQPETKGIKWHQRNAGWQDRAIKRGEEGYHW